MTYEDLSIGKYL